MPVPLPNIPSPDPSQLTTAQIHEAIVNSQALFDVRIKAVEDVHNIFREDLTRMPTLLDREVSRLQQVFNQHLAGMGNLFVEKFSGVQIQLKERDERAKTLSDLIKESTKTLSDANEKALSAALKTQLEAANSKSASDAIALDKSERSTTREIEALKALQINNATFVNDKITDINRRLDRGEGGQGGIAAAEALAMSRTNSTAASEALTVARTNSHNSSVSMMVSVGALILSGLLGLYTVLHVGGAVPAAAPVYLAPPTAGK